MPTTLQPEILLATLKYDFKVMQRENSPNEVQKWYPRGTNFFGVRLATLYRLLSSLLQFHQHPNHLEFFCNYLHRHHVQDDCFYCETF